MNYPGVMAKNGAELIESFARSVAAWDINAQLGVTIEAVDCRFRTVELADGRTFTGDALFIATGVRRRRLGVPGESKFQGKGILNSGAGEKENVKGKRVVVVGGGDAAAENALLLSPFAEKVLLVHRRANLTARTAFQERIAATPNIELIIDSEIVEIGGADRVEWVEIISRSDDSRSRIDTDHFIARIGVTPNTEFVSSQLECKKGYLVVDSLCRTGVEGIYGIGDVANPISPTIPTAVGAGATAAKDWAARRNLNVEL